jgi:tetratricopeptide (TPR) repeat protein
VRTVRLVIALALGCGGAARAQLAITQPTTKLLILPLGVDSPADSGASVATMDAARDRLAVLARYKVIVVPKIKLCEALKASGFPCDLVLDEGEARELARFLNVQAYTTGMLERSDSTLSARVRVVDIGSSGFPFLFAVAVGNPGTPAALGEAIAQRLNRIVRAGESARECYDKRMKGQLASAIDAVHKALSVEPTLPAAHLCLATVYEAQRLSPDSLIAAALRATRGDSLNPTAWETIARAYQMKGDTVKAIDAFQHELRGEPQNTQLRLGIAELLRQQRLHPLAVTVLDEGLARKPGDPKLLDLKARICIEGQLWRCVLEGFVQRAEADSSVLGDSTFLKAALGAAQQMADTQQLLFFGRAAVRHFPSSAAFWNALGQAFDLKGMPDSALAAYRKALALEPSDVKATLLVAKAIVDQATYDTAAANHLKSDTARLRAFRTAFADRLDTAHAYLSRSLASPDSGQQLSAAVILLLTGGSKLAQAGAYERAYPWLDEALRAVAPRSPADTTGPRQQVRVQASFWFGIASVASLQDPYRQMVASKSCADAKAIHTRLERTREALVLGARVSPNFANTMLQNLAKFEAVMPQVKKQFRCSNF